jgi:hypothetical protein
VSPQKSSRKCDSYDFNRRVWIHHRRYVKNDLPKCRGAVVGPPVHNALCDPDHNQIAGLLAPKTAEPVNREIPTRLRSTYSSMMNNHIVGKKGAMSWHYHRICSERDILLKLLFGFNILNRRRRVVPIKHGLRTDANECGLHIQRQPRPTPYRINRSIFMIRSVDCHKRFHHHHLHIVENQVPSVLSTEAIEHSLPGISPVVQRLPFFR